MKSIQLTTTDILRLELEKTKNEMLKWYIGIAVVQTLSMLIGIIALAKILHP